MNLRAKTKNVRGIALIMVMLIVVALAFLAFGLASSMKVETKLARNSSWDMELEWMGRSGIEMAKYFLAQPKQGPAVDMANQLWAGGTAETNDALAGLSLTDNKLGHGTFSVKITDADRKFNINYAASAAPEVLNQGLILMGVDGAEAPRIVNAIADWIDKDDKPRIGSSDTESAYYESLQPPHRAKDGYIDDLTELMMIKGITPAMYFGPGGGGSGNAGQQMFTQSANRFNRRQDQEPVYAAGFVDLFTSVGERVNFNFASATVMQLFPAIDASDAQAIIEARGGYNKVEGDDDDVPFLGPGDIVAKVPNLSPQAKEFLAGPNAARFISGVSTTFEVQVDAQIDDVKRTYFALLRRAGPNQIALLYMYWR